MSDSKEVDHIEDEPVTVVEIDPELEKQALRRFDIFLLPQIAILIIISYLDRSNIGSCITLAKRPLIIYLS